MSSSDMHPDARALDLYRRRLAPPDELLACDAHIAGCDVCYEAVRAEPAEIALPTRRDRHTSYDDLESFVDGRADPVDRELVAAHIASCTTCLNELTDLTAVSRAMRYRLPRPLQHVRAVPRS